MRRIGRELGVEATSLYEYVRSKEDILDGLTELIGRELPIPPDATEPVDVLRAYIVGLHEAAWRHPAAFRVLAPRNFVAADPAPAMDAAFNALRRMGFDDRQAICGIRAMASFARGYALSELTAAPVGEDRDADGTSGLPPDAFPRVEAYAEVLGSLDPESAFTFCADAILLGLQALVGRPGAPLERQQTPDSPSA